MYAQSRKYRDTTAEVNTSFAPAYHNVGKPKEVESVIFKQMLKFPIGSSILFCDRADVIEATVYENAILNQLSVVDKQGFLHVGLIAQHKEYEAITIVSVKEKVKQGYKPAKSHGIPLVNH